MKQKAENIYKVLLTAVMGLVIQGLMISPVGAQEIKDKPVQAAGCKTAYFLMQDLVEDYEKQTNMSILPQRVGNKVAVKLLVADDIEFAFTCQPHENLTKNVQVPDQQAQSWRSVHFAKDPVVVVVNQTNKVTNLTKTQLTDIFTGKISNWKNVGGDDLQVKLAYQDESTESGVMVVFREQTVGRHKGVLGELSPNAVRFPGPKKRGAYISQNPGAVTYMGLGAYRERYGKLLDINGAAPSRENIVNGRYPLAATYYIVYDEKNRTMVEPFLNYLASEEGKATINRNFVAHLE